MHKASKILLVMLVGLAWQSGARAETLPLTSADALDSAHPSTAIFTADPANASVSTDLTATPADMAALRNDPSHNHATPELPVEPIPSPTAVSSGLVLLAGLAGIKLIRRIRLAA